MGPSANSALAGVEQLLARYGRFGVELGLERIERLLAALNYPHHKVPTIHVAGTNGKGSVCAYLSSVLAAAGYRVGRYTSPHLVSWCDRITLNLQPIAAITLLTMLQRVEAAIDPTYASPTQFEVLTAAMWLYFSEAQVDVAVIEVGLGGRLDATNVCQQPLVSIITSLSLEHWQRLGPTLAHIAYEKAGILKPNCPAVIGPIPPEAQRVVSQRLQEVGCPSIWPQPATPLGDWAEYRGDNAAVFDTSGNFQFKSTLPPLRYPLPLKGAHQRINSALAIAAIDCLHSQGWDLPIETIIKGMGQARWPGRLEWVSWRGRPILIDGAHNPAAATVLRDYIDELSPTAPPQPTTWLMGMLSTKDHADIFQALLRTGDQLHLVPVPDHDSAPPRHLKSLAETICPDLAVCQVHPDLNAALAAASAQPIVLCGSLYLIGHFLAAEDSSLQRSISPPSRRAGAS